MSEIRQRVEELLRSFDETSEPFHVASISDALREFQPDEAEVNDHDRSILMAESMAFGFHEDYQDENTGWGTYYGPMMVRQDENGQWVEAPSIKRVTPEMLDYWQLRLGEVCNPILQSRYADLVWDFSRVVKGNYPDIHVAHALIDASLAIAEGGHHKYETWAITKLRRGLSVALSIRDEQRIKAVRDAMIAFEDKISQDDKIGLWGFCFDYLLGNRKVPLTEKQSRKIRDDLENRLKRASKSEETELNPHAAEAAAMRLAHYYRRTDQIEEARRVLRLYGQAVIAASESVAPLVGSAWIQKVYETYYEYGMKEDADVLATRLEEMGRRAGEEMHTISHEFSIPTEELEKYIAAITDGSLAEVLTRIARHYLPDTDEVAQQVRELAKRAPLQALIPRSLQDQDGRTVAQVGSVEDDFDGRVVLQMSQRMQIESVFLREVIERTLSKFAPSVEDLLNYLYLSPAFDPDSREIISVGLETYLRGDYLAAAHVLIPQIEHTLRQLMRLTGGAIYRPARGGGLFLRNLDEILRYEGVVRSLGSNITDYLRVLLTDQRGWNLRNDVCHGIARPSSFGAMMADRLFHTLLLLGQVRVQPATQVEQIP
jgi:hypothetical protein